MYIVECVSRSSESNCKTNEKIIPSPDLYSVPHNTAERVSLLPTLRGHSPQ